MSLKDLERQIAVGQQYNCPSDLKDVVKAEDDWHRPIDKAKEKKIAELAQKANQAQEEANQLLEEIRKLQNET